MYGLFVALGSAANRLTKEAVLAAWKETSPANIEVVNLWGELLVVLFMPKTERQAAAFAWSRKKMIGVAADGYLVSRANGSVTSHISHLSDLAEQIQQQGILSGLKAILAGSFNAVIIDQARETCSVANDRMGSIPLYYAKLDAGCLLSTNPVALAATGLISKNIDYTACAEWAYIGYTIGDRYFLKEIKLLPPASILQWDKKTKTCKLERTDLNPFLILPDTRKTDLDEIANRFSASCQRLVSLGGKTAHLQSAGLDSRLILAAWPEEQELPCYTYGNPDSVEVMIAKSITQIKGSAFTHVWPSGDDVAECLEAIFFANGLMVYPDRFLTAKKICHDGFNNLSDGFLGDVLLGGLFFSCDRYFSRLHKYAGYLTKFIDHNISAIGLDAITQALFDDICEIKGNEYLNRYLKEDFILKLHTEKANVLQDIYNYLQPLISGHDSVAVLWRNFKLANRSQHAILQQGVMSRQFVQVYYPFSNDFALPELLLKISPTAIAYNKLYVNLFKQHFPAYANVLYGASLLPLKRSALSHRFSVLTLANDMSIPLITGKKSGKALKPNNWPLWLSTSSLLRKKTIVWLCEGGIGDERQLRLTMNKLAAGEEQGSGKLFHLASIAKWLRIAHS